MTLSVLPTDKTQSFGHLRFNSTLKITIGISSGFQKLLKHITHQLLRFSEFHLQHLEQVELKINLKDLKLLLLATSVLKLVSSSSE